MLVLNYVEWQLEYIFHILNIFKLLLFPIIILVYINFFHTLSASMVDNTLFMTPFQVNFNIEKTNQALNAIKRAASENPRSAIFGVLIAGLSGFTVNYGYRQQQEINNITETLGINAKELHPNIQISENQLQELVDLKLTASTSAFNIISQDISRSFNGESSIAWSYKRLGMEVFLKNREALRDDYLKNREALRDESELSYLPASAKALIEDKSEIASPIEELIFPFFSLSVACIFIFYIYCDFLFL